MRRMTVSEATELLEQCFNVSPDSTCGMVEAFIGDIDVGQANQDISSYLALIPNDFDPDTIRVSPDTDDDGDIDCVKITIKTEDIGYA